MGWKGNPVPQGPPERGRARCRIARQRFEGLAVESAGNAVANVFAARGVNLVRPWVRSPGIGHGTGLFLVLAFAFAGELDALGHDGIDLHGIADHDRACVCLAVLLADEGVGIAHAAGRHHGVALAEIHAVQELGGPAPEFHGGSHRAERIVRIAAVLLTDSRAVLIHGGAQVRRARGAVRVGFRRPVIGVRGEETANHLH